MTAAISGKGSPAAAAMSASCAAASEGVPPNRSMRAPRAIAITDATSAAERACSSSRR
jgi:hypothetical protein